ncbi:OmcA/MtrC family decaheme c-type cytochrome [Shewanella gelidii]|nr:OmcA/MtrC family decaheme c-type cytochrome [Shewanella gelidii]MCL1097430.1 OmcA/MtrC family decaheme c-type cytochrome [Shewanella gelidii]
MMRRFSLNTATKALLGAGMLSFVLVGCGSDGKDGEDGKDGVVGVSIDTTSSLTATFTNASIDAGTVTVDFELTNANGVAVLGLNKDYDLRFGIAQLTQVFEAAGDAQVDRGLQWQAYINSQKEPNPDWIPEDDDNLSPSTQFQAGVEAAKNCDDCLIDNLDGSYTYTYQIDVANVTTPLQVTYNADNTQRATLELKLPQITANAAYDWQPSTGATEGITSREVVSITACYQCHQPESLALHGGRRLDLENCASCHTATSGDPESGNSVDFTYMIHAIHKGNERMIATEEGMVPAPYKVIGYGGGMHDYGNVMFPLYPATDCSSCHVEGEGAPADAALFKADKSNTACIACHTEKPSMNHSSTDCVACHNATDPYNGTNNAEKRHGDVNKRYQVSKLYSAVFTNIAPAGQGLSFDVQLLDDSGNPIAKEFVYKKGFSKPYIVVSWDIDKDYPAYETGSRYSERRIDLYDDTQSVYDTASKTFSVTSANIVLPADINGKSFELLPLVKTCFNTGGYGVDEVNPMACYDTEGELLNNAAPAYIQDQPLRFTWNNGYSDTAATARRTIIDDAKCHACHGAEFYHDSNGVNCMSCHTPDKSLKESVRGSGEFDKPTSFAYKAHHADGHYLKYAGVQSGTVLKTDCSTCHTDGGFALGRSSDRVWHYPNLDTKDADGVWVSSDAGTCLSCHQPYLNDAAINHIEINGGIIDGVDADDVRTRAKETCSTCHSSEQVLSVHGH